jgi:hypothetical protein
LAPVTWAGLSGPWSSSINSQVWSVTAMRPFSIRPATAVTRSNTTKTCWLNLLPFGCNYPDLKSASLLYYLRAPTEGPLHFATTAADRICGAYFSQAAPQCSTKHSTQSSGVAINTTQLLPDQGLAAAAVAPAAAGAVSWPAEQSGESTTTSKTCHRCL